MRKFASRGERHHRAILTDAEVESIRRLHAEHQTGHPSHLGYRRLARMFEISRETIRRVVKEWGRV